MKHIHKIIAVVLLSLSGLQAWGQGYDPGNPPEPQAPQLPLTVTCSPSGAGTQSGTGSYVAGTTVTIKTTPKQFYTFSHWTKNGEVYGATTTSFSYTTDDQSASFVAVYTKDPTCVVTTSVSPAAAGSASGAGTYAIGSTVSVKTSGNVGYNFSHWTLNGEVYSSTSTTLTYTAEEGTKAFVAVYEYDPTFDPTLPAEPSMTVKSRLFLQSEPAGICTFNRTSGAYANADQYVALNITGTNQGYTFDGWYQGDELVTTSKSFNFLMTYDDATLTARFHETPPPPVLPFDPTNPSEPESQGGDIQTSSKGDVNGDGVIDVTDAVAVINAYLSGNANAVSLALADMNGDGIIDITDAVAIINIYLNAE